jgi:hypothetical protein
MDSDGVRATIRDDGIGGASLAGGSGLIGLVDRVEALGGKIALESPARRAPRSLSSCPCAPRRRTGRPRAAASFAVHTSHDGGQMTDVTTAGSCQPLRVISMLRNAPRGAEEEHVLIAGTPNTPSRKS